MSPRDKNSSQQQHQSTTNGNRMSLKNRIYLTSGIMIFTAIAASAVTVLVMQGLGLNGGKSSTQPTVSPTPSVPTPSVSPTPSVPTLSVSPTPSVPTPSVSPTPSVPTPSESPTLSVPTPSVSQPIQTWEGTANQPNYGKYQMKLYVEKMSKTTFSGKIHFPSIQNSIFSTEGRFVTDFGDVLERSKWGYVEGFDKDKSGTWLTFSAGELLQGGGVNLTTVYYAHRRDDGTMQGVMFYDQKASVPIANFNLDLKK